MFQVHMTWLEPQPSSEAQIKLEQTEDGSDSSSSSGSIEVPIARSRLLQLSRSNDLDGTTSSRSWREDERRLASTERRRRRLSGRKTRFCPHADKICLCTEEDLVSRPLGATEHIQDQSVYAPGRTKED
ncbi:hypothetical protein CVIRNUC_007074 [Coccomyxa viridis]|uniref:Uncharacterized protein n=1 Tax=Coccomyxa viridis TaxID=1274662 RepID=A0AAV1ID18_9CHLO|nr:hypothetical protein CVIRNUC_007074 [Coccomyxa viridis]